MDPATTRAGRSRRTLRSEPSGGMTLEKMVDGINMLNRDRDGALLGAEEEEEKISVQDFHEEEEEKISVQDFHKEESRAILLPHFSGSENAMRHAGLTGFADISFRQDVTPADAGKQQLLSSYSELFGETSARGDPAMPFARPAAVTTQKRGDDMPMRVRVPGHQPLINADVMPGYNFVRDLDSKLVGDKPALAFSLNTSYMSLPSSRQETLLLANWAQKSLQALREGRGPASAHYSKGAKLDSLESLMSNPSLDWEGLPQTQVSPELPALFDSSGSHHFTTSPKLTLSLRSLSPSKILSLAMTDMIRQVGAHCAERSAVLAFLWNEMVDLFENRTNYLEDVISRYDAKISVLLAEAPRLRKQSKLFEDASKKLRSSPRSPRTPRTGTTW